MDSLSLCREWADIFESLTDYPETRPGWDQRKHDADEVWMRAGQVPA